MRIHTVKRQVKGANAIKRISSNCDRLEFRVIEIIFTLLKREKINVKEAKGKERKVKTFQP